MLPIALLLAGGSVAVAAVGAVSASKRDALFADQREIWSIGSPAYVAALAAEKKTADEASEAARVLADKVSRAFGGGGGSGYVADDDIGMPLPPSGSQAGPRRPTRYEATANVAKGTIKFASQAAATAYLVSYGVPPQIAGPLAENAADIQGYAIDKIEAAYQYVGQKTVDGAKAVYGAFKGLF